MIRSLVGTAILSILPAITLLAQANPGQNVQTEQEHTEWIRHVLAAIGTIKPGMTRRELASVLDPDGGLSSRIHGRYIYKHCPYIKVDVEFIPADRSQTEKPEDRIVRISHPYLADPVYD